MSFYIPFRYSNYINSIFFIAVPAGACKCIGVELLECGNFECTNNWTPTGGWSIGNGVASKAFGGGSNWLRYEFIKPLLGGNCYRLE